MISDDSAAVVVALSQDLLVPELIVSLGPPVLVLQVAPLDAEAYVVAYQYLSLIGRGSQMHYPSHSTLPGKTPA